MQYKIGQIVLKRFQRDVVKTINVEPMQTPTDAETQMCLSAVKFIQYTTDL